MWFWLVMIVLLAIAVFLIFQCVMAVKNQRGNGSGDEDYEPERYERTRRKRPQASQARNVRRQREEPEDDEEDEEEEEEYVPRRAGQKQWKVLLENLDTWEKYTYVFYDEIGIGRAKDSPDFEEFLTIEGDPRVSKQHCAIIRKGGRLYLEDLGSKNGTYLNEERVDDVILIQKEDVIRVGETRIEINKILRERD